MSELVKPTNSIIGHARTIKTAILCCEYIRARCCHPHSKIHPDWVKYTFTNPTVDNGYWCSDIIVQTYGDGGAGLSLADSSIFVAACRAFVAGAGEIWA